MKIDFRFREHNAMLFILPSRLLLLISLCIALMACVTNFSMDRASEVGELQKTTLSKNCRFSYHVKLRDTSGIMISYESNTSKLVKMKSYLNEIRLDSPIIDARRDFEKMDFRVFFQNDGIGMTIPGVKDEDFQFFCKNDVREMIGSLPDSRTGNEDFELVARINNYVKLYNQEKIRLIKQDME